MDEDERMEDTEPSRALPLLFSEDELLVLELYDKLQQTQLEIAILKAQKQQQSGMLPRIRPRMPPRCEISPGF